MSALPELEQTLEDHDKAFTEVSFLLEILINTVDDLVGGAIATVGRTAGKDMSRKVPVYLPEPTLTSVLEALQGQLGQGFELTFDADDSGADLKYGRCAVRDVCRNRGQEPGGQLCKMFHFYVSGLTEGLLGQAAIERATSAGDTCTTTLRVRG